jgi:glycosyltransferase involved in cell wall biosynthesis
MTDCRTPAVSVVIPTYNRRRRVEQAVSSVLAQTFRDFELLVIDDGSEDGTGASLAGLDDRLRYRWQANRGPAAARNRGIRLARAPVVAFLDADVRWLPDHLEVVVAVFARHPEALLTSTCPGFKIAGDEQPQDAQLIDPLPSELLSNGTGYISGVAVRRDALIEVGGLDERLEVAEDDDLWLRLAINGPFATVRRRTIVRRHTRGGLRDRGRRGGIYTEANTVSLRRVIADLVRRPGCADREDLLAYARGRLHVLAAVAALERGDLGAAREDLTQACALAPELERNPGLILGQLWKSAHGRAELQRRVEDAAAAMPNPSCHSALFFRGYAAGSSAMRGRLWKAGRLVLRRPHLVRRDFAAKALRPAAVLIRNRLKEILQGREESSLAR